MVQTEQALVAEVERCFAILSAKEERAEAAFKRWFAKAQAGEPTNAAAATRLANEVNYLTAEVSSAISRLFIAYPETTYEIPEGFA